MSIIVKDSEIKVAKGKTPVRSIMLGEKCIYGENRTMYVINYPAMPKGVGLTISINGETVLSNPTVNGRVGVMAEDSVQIRTYGLANYKNPNASVFSNTEEITGEIYSIQVSDVSIDRATDFFFVANASVTLNVDAPEKVELIRVAISKDEGVQDLNISYKSSPCEVAFESNRSFTPITHTKEEFTSDYIDVVYGSVIDRLSANYVEGYKAKTSSISHLGAITREKQCLIDVSTIKGKPITLTCPALPDGVSSYSIYIVSSAYSRHSGDSKLIYSGCDKSTELSTRVHNEKTYFLYNEDVIKIVASRVIGYKKPTLGISDNKGEAVDEKKVALTKSTDIVVKGGEAGVLVELENNALSTGEYVLLNVESEYNYSQYRSQDPTIYRGDKISIPLSVNHRIGTSSHRKPGVGLTDGEAVIEDVTFTSEIDYTVKNISKLCVVLQQGAERIVTSDLDKVALISADSTGSYSSRVFGLAGTETRIPIEGYGEECFYIDSSSLSLLYYTKRYLGDAIKNKFIRNESSKLPTPFSCDCTSNIGIEYTGVIKGSYEISSDKTSVTMRIDKYNKNWVSNHFMDVTLYANTIII